ncbi:cyclic AMP-responsive element-binding protein 3-like protein 1 [Branchiostoma floridae]|uniref:Cyclic AMP-responsive element-binding protein 3-like protein 1 n=1 Tax=Branchiostoma floridae TaxID=7739 RepID=A0A9J7KGX8_BRAFL|nr:cyclic AMP-responsive element-binding protein 3-like protein 1 [Branchiostoma floridae]
MDSLAHDRKLSELGSNDFNDILDTDVFRLPPNDQLDDLPSDWLNGLLDEPLIPDKPLNDVSLAPPPQIQAEHSYSMMSAADLAMEESLRIKTEENDFDMADWMTSGHMDHGMMHDDPMDYDMGNTAYHMAEQMEPLDLIKIKTEPTDPDLYFHTGADDLDVQMPPTPPSSASSDSEGGSSPRAIPDSPTRPTFSKQAGQSSGPMSPNPGQNLLTNFQKLPPSGPLILTEEEKRTLISEGYPIPTKLPLTKAEEKSLKKVRRKIKNKISAQESRRKKKEYVDQLEKRVENFTHENNELRKKCNTLESSNKTLLVQLQKLQALVNRVPRPCRTNATQTGTCLMVLVVFFAIFLGSWSPTLYLPSMTSYLPTPFTHSVVQSNSGPNHIGLAGVPHSGGGDDYTTPNRHSSRALFAFTEEVTDDVSHFEQGLDPVLEKLWQELPDDAYAIVNNETDKPLVLSGGEEDAAFGSGTVLHPDIAAEVSSKLISLEHRANATA